MLTAPVVENDEVDDKYDALVVLAASEGDCSSSSCPHLSGDVVSASELQHFPSQY
jgi:hypothetical protein